jgi:hypothetical protein
MTKEVQDMNQESIHKWTRRQPFMPFQLQLTDGRRFEIRHPDMIAAGRHEAVVIGPRQQEPNAVDEPFFVSYFHIVTIEALGQDQSSDANKNGQASK